ncbi:MAG: TraG family conjugative transposon ATPase [Bacteroidales bacterium]|nr:TraG family conjugative transposon ATPase [Bacteroidales bacterium]
MQTIRKVEYQDLYPVLEVNEECIIGKSGDICICFLMSLPAKNSLSADEYSEMRQLLIRAFGTLPVGTIILKQDIYFSTHNEMGNKDDGYLIQCYNSHFNHRQYLQHTSLLQFTMPHRNRQDISSLGSILTRGNIFTQKVQADIYTFVDSVEQAVNMLTSDKRLMQLRKLTPNEINDISGKIINFCNNEQYILEDIQLQPDKVKISDREIYNLSVTSLKDMPNSFEENVIDRILSTDTTKLYSSILAQIGYNIASNHIVNQYIKIVDSNKAMSRLESKSRFLRSMSGISADNATHYEHISEYMEEVAENNLQTVRFSVQILVEGSTDINNLVTSLLRHGIHLRKNGYNCPVPYWASIPGNSADLPDEEYMTQSLQVATSLASLETASTGIKNGSFYVTDRTTHVPVAIDLSTVAQERGLITNYNIFTLGPSGSGKSFLTNEYITQSYYRDQAHCVLIDQGNSYFSLCQIIREQTNGNDGIYYNADDYPFSFNPFLNVTSEEDKTFLLSLIYCIWKKKSPSAAEDALLYEAIELYLSEGTWCDRTMDNFRNWLNDTWSIAKADDIASCGFAIKDLLIALKPFCLGGKYSTLLNNKQNINLSTKRFVLFEIDSISNNEVLFPIITLLITKLFADKMKAVKERKIMLIEEAWKAISSPEMEGWIQWLWKTARKHNAQAMVVTQEVEDIISSPVVKQAIINNSAIRILLDQKSLKDKYDDIAAILALNNQDKNLIFSINKDLDRRYKYREAYICIGSHKYVYALETSPQAYWAYTTTRSEQVLLKNEVEKCGGSYIHAIDNLTQDH